MAFEVAIPFYDFSHFSFLICYAYKRRFITSFFTTWSGILWGLGGKCPKFCRLFAPRRAAVVADASGQPD
jgi:hypothetical protein